MYILPAHNTCFWLTQLDLFLLNFIVKEVLKYVVNCFFTLETLQFENFFHFILCLRTQVKESQTRAPIRMSWVLSLNEVSVNDLFEIRY